jgi:S-DNA-T family DNA segregation ATPase FtsK/SpoIIIE
VNQQSKTNPLGVALYWAASILALALLGSLVDRSWPWGQTPHFFRVLGFPTRMIFDAFHLASFYLPLFLLVQARLTRHKQVSLGLFIGSLVSLLPALSLAGVLRILFTESFMLSPLPSWIVRTLTLEGAVMVLSLFTLFSGLITYQIGKAVVSTAKQDPDSELDLPIYHNNQVQQSKVQQSDNQLEDSEQPQKPPQEPPGQSITLQNTISIKSEESDSQIVDDQDLSEIRKDPWFYQESTEEKPEVLETQLLSTQPGPEQTQEFPEQASEDQRIPDKLIPVARSESDHMERLEDQHQQTSEEDLEIFFSRGKISDVPSSTTNPGIIAQDPQYPQDELQPEESLEEVVLGSDPDVSSLIDRFDHIQSGDMYDPDSLEELDLEPDLESTDEELQEDSTEVLQTRDSIDDDEPVDESILPPPEPAKFTGPYDVPIRGILDVFENDHHWQIDKAATDAAEVLRTTLQEFGIQAEVTGIRKGPVITMFEILPAPGVKLTRIVNLQDNIALRLAASSVRIVAPIPGKHAVGIEIPNKNRHLVGFAELLQDPLFHDPKHEIPVALGKDITGDAQIVDLAKTPHLLIAGATGSGKSVCVNSLICSVLYRRSPEEVKMILIDPKIVELKFYNDIPHLLTPVITDAKKAFQALQWCIYEMERRYSLLDAMAVRDVRSYNKKIKTKHIATTPLPYIVVIIDEFADLMATTGKELESTLARLAAMSRAVGIHLVLATQRPSTDVITGLIKANIPSRIAFMVASKIDSRIILDAMGAEKLLGKGDMLFTSAWNPFPTRMQGAFLSEEEVERVVEHVRTMGKPDYIDDEIFIEDDEDETFYQEDLEDPLMEKAIEIVVSAGKASASYLQRRLKIGYNRAARMVEMLEEMGIVGPQNGSKAREILRSPEIAASRDR